MLRLGLADGDTASPLVTPRFASNAMSRPSGEYAASPLNPTESVSLITSLPSALIEKTSLMMLLSERSGSDRSLSKAIREASGDQTGQPLSASPLVNLCSAPRSGLDVHTCQKPLCSCRMNVR